MKIAVLKEQAAGENRVALHPETVKKYINLGFSVFVEQGAGEAASITDDEYIAAGANVSKIPLEIIADANIVLKVQPSMPVEGKKRDLTENGLMKEGSIVVGFLSPFENKELINEYASKNITSFAVEFIPRITRAQSMDALSSQSNLAGYRAVIEATNQYNRLFPMLMTAAGTIHPAKVLVLGAGVAGLQAIATARRLGAIVSAFDVRAAAKEQVESLGANFISVPVEEEGSTGGGYAKEMSEEYKKKQSELIEKAVIEHNIVISTALIPGKAAPELITKEMVKKMKSGSVIIDMAAIAGGNCKLTEKDNVVIYNNVKIVGYTNFPSLVATESSRLYSNNLFNFVSLLVDKEKKSININLEDEIIRKSMLTYNGEVVCDLIKS